LEWLQFIYGLCTSGVPPANWRAITVISNAAIAGAYFWIPAVMGVVFSRWREELARLMHSDRVPSREWLELMLA